jgi:four helix bundle protein
MMQQFQKSNPVREKSFAFACRVVKACQFLQKKKEYVLSRQLLRAGTSIGANTEEAIHAQSKPEFIAKLQIAIKEAFESEYWIRLLQESDYLTKMQASSLLNDVCEIQKLLTSIIKKAKSR